MDGQVFPDIIELLLKCCFLFLAERYHFSEKVYNNLGTRRKTYIPKTYELIQTSFLSEEWKAKLLELIKRN